MPHARDDRGRGSRLARSMHVPARATTGTPPVLSGASGIELAVTDARGTPMRSPRYGKCSTPPMTRQSNGLPLSGFTESTTPSTPPMLSIWMMSPGFTLVGHVARVSEQRLAMPERAHDDIALADLGHAAAGELERVVVGLVGQYLHDHDHAFLGGDVVGGDAHLVAEAARLGDRANLVYDYGTHHFPPARAWNMPVSETIFEKPRASCGVHSP
jgi:hypothetical protein